MIKTIQKTLFFLFLILFSACTGRNGLSEMAPPADLQNLPALQGTYVVNGFDPLGMEYSGHLTIVPGQEPGAYLMQWIVIGGIQEGQGVVKGNQLFVDWKTIESAAQQTRGTALYTITQTGQLDGIRWVDGLDGEGTEQAYPNP